MKNTEIQQDIHRTEQIFFFNKIISLNLIVVLYLLY